MARYTFATTIALKNQLPIKVVDEVLGLKSIEQTREYEELLMLNVAKSMERVNQIIMSKFTKA
jgi:site-specific recombinase XerD